MLHQVARKFDTEWDKARMTEFAGALGAGTLLRVASSFGVRQLVKLVPCLRPDGRCGCGSGRELRDDLRHGQGRSALSQRRRSGLAVRDVARVYKQALAEAFAYSKTHPITPSERGGAPS